MLSERVAQMSFTYASINIVVLTCQRQIANCASNICIERFIQQKFNDIYKVS